MFNTYKFHAEQHEHCKDLIREAERAGLIREALANRKYSGIFRSLIRMLTNLVQHKRQESI